MQANKATRTSLLYRYCYPSRPAILVISSSKPSSVWPYICEGISRGFRIGFNCQYCTCKSATSNMASAKQHPQPVAKYLAEELEPKRIAGPLPPAMSSKIQVNRFGVIPKRSQPGKWCLITDLSHREQRSVNDGINPDWCGVHYASFDDAVRKILSTERGIRLAKIDVQHAFHNIPVHPQDRTIRHGMGRTPLHGYNPAIRPQVCPPNFLLSR